MVAFATGCARLAAHIGDLDFVSLPEIEPVTPPPIAASFIDLNETEDAKFVTASPQSAPRSTSGTTQARRNRIETGTEITTTASKEGPPPRPKKPKMPEKPSKPAATQPAKEKQRLHLKPLRMRGGLSIILIGGARRRAEGIFDNQETVAANTAAQQPQPMKSAWRISGGISRTRYQRNIPNMRIGLHG